MAWEAANILLARQSAHKSAAIEGAAMDSRAGRANQLLIATRAALLVDKAHLKNMGPHT